MGSNMTDNGSGTNQDSLSDWTTIVNQGIALCDARKIVFSLHLQEKLM